MVDMAVGVVVWGGGGGVGSNLRKSHEKVL